MKQLIYWRDEMLIGDELIDNQHKNLVNFINEFYSRIENLIDNEDPGYFRRIEENLFDYIMLHFKTEEKYMETIEIDPELLEKHLLEHKRFKDHLYEIMKKFDKGDNIYEEICLFLVTWVENHVRNVDLITLKKE
jgi:hemerythrin